MSLVKSRYNIELEELGYLLIFNTRSCSLVKLDYLDYYKWRTDFTKLDSKDLSWLIEHRFIVDNEDELSSVMELYNHIVSRDLDPVYRILTTTACNARCIYCFEKEMSVQTMDLQTADRVIDFIKHSLNNHKAIRLDWFGGEPLINKEIISYVCTKLREVLPNIIFQSSMTSNGSLFDQETILESKNWNLTSVQITLDGTESVHDSIKRYTSNKYNFKKTIENIHNLIDNDISVSIRLNFHTGNVPDLLNLIDFLYNEYGTKIGVYASQIYDVGKVSEKYEPMFAGNILIGKLVEYGYLKLEKIIEQSQRTCGFATHSNYYIINPNGSLTKCVESFSRPELSVVGDVRDDKLNIDLIDEWSKPVSDKRCINCIYLPMCFGGCVAARWGIVSTRCFRYKNFMELIIRKLGCSAKDLFS